MIVVSLLILFYLLKLHELSRKEDNDQESVQLPNTFRSKTPKGKKDALKVTTPQSNHCSRKPKGQFLPKNGQMTIRNKNFTKIYKQRHTMIDIVNHSRSTALERSIICYWGEGVFYVATILAFSSVVVYRRHLFSPRE